VLSSCCDRALAVCSAAVGGRSRQVVCDDDGARLYYDRTSPSLAPPLPCAHHPWPLPFRVLTTRAPTSSLTIPAPRSSSGPTSSLTIPAPRSWPVQGGYDSNGAWLDMDEAKEEVEEAEARAAQLRKRSMTGKLTWDEAAEPWLLLETPVHTALLHILSPSHPLSSHPLSSHHLSFAPSLLHTLSPSFTPYRSHPAIPTLPFAGKLTSEEAAELERLNGRYTTTTANLTTPGPSVLTIPGHSCAHHPWSLRGSPSLVPPLPVLTIPGPSPSCAHHPWSP
jgi:hypothetical protein